MRWRARLDAYLHRGACARHGRSARARRTRRGGGARRGAWANRPGRRGRKALRRAARAGRGGAARDARAHLPLFDGADYQEPPRHGRCDCGGCLLGAGSAPLPAADRPFKLEVAPAHRDHRRLQGALRRASVGGGLCDDTAHVPPLRTRTAPPRDGAAPPYRLRHPRAPVHFHALLAGARRAAPRGLPLLRAAAGGGGRGGR
mmetsp:Transcript_6002/g.18861  ORF Transcript_6002/g.18861 Transcript_6002/m.18861 type:complete len:202 (-) Transcript_6002:254-859(-)